MCIRDSDSFKRTLERELAKMMGSVLDWRLHGLLDLEAVMGVIPERTYCKYPTSSIDEMRWNWHWMTGFEFRHRRHGAVVTAHRHQHNNVNSAPCRNLSVPHHFRRRRRRSVWAAGVDDRMRRDIITTLLSFIELARPYVGGTAVRPSVPGIATVVCSRLSRSSSERALPVP